MMQDVRVSSAPPAPDLAERMRSYASTAPGPRWIFFYIFLQFFCQLVLLVPQLSVARVIARSLAFGSSLLLLAIVPGKSLTRDPARAAVLVILAIVSLSTLNPEGSTPLAVGVSWLFYIAIAAPVFWVARLRCDDRALERVLVMLWLFSTLSAIVGVLQAMFPGSFVPNVGVFASEHGKRSIGPLMIRLANGAWIPRPTGLTDTPGGATAGAMYATLLGVGIALVRPIPYARLAAAISMIAGLTCLYLCQVRAAVVMTGVCLVTLMGVLALSGRVSRSLFVGAFVGGLVIAAFFFAFALGGETVTSRLETLVSDDAGTVYYRARGGFLERTFSLHLPRYPLGAGLGRWGMVNYYFGDTSRQLWVEIQWTGWLYDGGILLLLAYPAAMLMATVHSFRVAFRHTTPRLETWSAVIAGYNVGAIALTFSYPIFAGTTGIEFWLLNTALVAARTQWEASQVRAVA